MSHKNVKKFFFLLIFILYNEKNIVFSMFRSIDTMFFIIYKQKIVLESIDTNLVKVKDVKRKNQWKKIRLENMPLDYKNESWKTNKS